MKIADLQKLLIKITTNNISQGDIAKALGVGRANISMRIKSGSNLNQNEITKIESYFNVSLKPYQTNSINIPVRGNVSASMGYGIMVYDETQTGSYQISNKLAVDLGLHDDKVEMIFASGDSMEPTIIGGDSLLIDLSRQEVYDGKIYCVRIEGQLYAKRLQKIPPNKIIVVSDNPKYKSFEVDFSVQNDFDFCIIGEVRWWGRVAR